MLRKCPPACCTSTGLHDRRYQARAAATQQQLCSRCAAAGTRRCALQYSQAAGKDSVNSTPQLIHPGTVCGCRWCYSGRLAENLHCAAPSQRPVRCPGCGRGARTDKQALQHLAGLGVALRKAPHGHKPVDGDQPRVFVLLLSGHPACAATGEQRPCDAPGAALPPHTRASVHPTYQCSASLVSHLASFLRGARAAGLFPHCHVNLCSLQRALHQQDKQ